MSPLPARPHRASSGRRLLRGVLADVLATLLRAQQVLEADVVLQPLDAEELPALRLAAKRSEMSKFGTGGRRHRRLGGPAEWLSGASRAWRSAKSQSHACEEAGLGSAAPPTTAL